MGFLAAAIAVSTIGTIAQTAASFKQLEADEKENRIRRRVAEIENVRNSRRAVQARLRQQADILASQESTGTNTNSAVSGAVGSIGTQTAANVGLQNTRLAGDIAANQKSLRGARQAGRLSTISNVASNTSELLLFGADA